MRTCCHHHTCYKTALKEAEELCQKQNARFTKHRRHVFDILWRGHKALTAAEIMEKMGNAQPPITYRALDFLKEMGLVHHIASLNAYVGCVHAKKQDHTGQMLICTHCRDVQELLSEKALAQLSNEVEEAHFHLTQTHIEMLGLCSNCHEAQA